MKVAIIGGGPAGLSAAIALGCEGIDASVFAPTWGGRMGVSPKVENIPGVVGGIDGAKWNEQLVEQARFFGANMLPAEVLGVVQEGSRHRLFVAGALDRIVVATEPEYDAIVIASGITMDAPTEPIMPPAPWADHTRIVVGAGDAAVQVALQNAATGQPTILAVRGNDLSKCSVYLRKRTLDAKNLTVLYNVEVEEMGNGYVHLNKTGTAQSVARAFNSSVQRLVGGTPKSAALFGVELDERGFILTDNQFHTSRPRVFAVGDTRAGSIKRVAVAAGEGIAVGHIIASVLRG